jgi:hypothetical protein
LLIQYIKNPTRCVNTEEIIRKYCKSQCVVIKIPHYTFSGFDYPYNAVLDDNISASMSNSELICYFNELYKNKPTQIQNHLAKELVHLQQLDALSDIKMHPIVVNNLTTTRFFLARSYPSNEFFHQAAVKIIIWNSSIWKFQISNGSNITNNC